jgi:hypothetical protein
MFLEDETGGDHKYFNEVELLKNSPFNMFFKVI